MINAYLALRKRLRGEQPQAGEIKAETVQSVEGNGKYTIEGRSIPAVGNIALTAGQQVDVAWKNARPVAILAHSARRAKFIPPLGGTVAGCIEELFAFPDGTPDQNGIWFRNADQLIRLMEFPANLVPVGHVHSIPVPVWGHGNADYFVLIGSFLDNINQPHSYIDVYKLNRPTANEPFPPGFNIKVTHVKFWDLLLESTGVSYGAISASSTTLPPATATPGVVTYVGGARVGSPYGPLGATPPFSIATINASYSCLATTEFQAIAPNGDTIVRISMRTTSGADATGITFDDGTGNSGITSQGLTVGSTSMGSVIVNMNRRTVLVNKLRATATFNISVFGPIPFPGPTPAACHAGGVVQFGISTGLSDVQAGEISVLSVKMEQDAPAVNNYMFRSPSRSPAIIETMIGTGLPTLCYDGTTFDILSLDVVGEFAQHLGTASGGIITGGALSLTIQDFIFQGSRTRVFWKRVQVRGGGNAEAFFFLNDLKGEISATINTDPAIVPWPSAKILALQANQILVAAFDIIAPYNHQYFVQGNARQIALDFPVVPDQFLTGLIKNNTLKVQSRLKVPVDKPPALHDLQVAVLNTSATTDVQVIDSRSSLGPFFQAGPL
jgi:hypothetical protein